VVIAVSWVLVVTRARWEPVAGVDLADNQVVLVAIAAKWGVVAILENLVTVDFPDNQGGADIQVR
jgi:hypothetical protein